MANIDIESSIESLGLSTRAYNALFKRCKTLQDVMNLGQKGLLKVDNLGLKSVVEIVDKMEKAGYTVPDSVVKKEDVKVNSTYLRELKKNGITFIKTLDAKKFLENSKSMQEIALAVEEWLNYYVQQALLEKSEQRLTYKQIENNVETFKETFREIVKYKREKLAKNEIDQKFIASMKTKISEVRKYKYSDKKHQDGHKRNPFVDDDVLGV